MAPWALGTIQEYYLETLIHFAGVVGHFRWLLSKTGFPFKFLFGFFTPNLIFLFFFGGCWGPGTIPGGSGKQMLNLVDFGPKTCHFPFLDKFCFLGGGKGSMVNNKCLFFFEDRVPW